MSLAEVPVWGRAQRLGHWSLAGCVLACLVLSEGGTWHLRLGYAALAIATWRTLRGLIGAPGERFSHFVRGPARTWAYWRALRHGLEPRHLGHNPLGAWMILALLSSTLLAGVTGALYNTDRFWGDALIYRLHQIGGWAFAVLVPLHLLGIALTSILQRENLVRAMLTGRKRPPGPGDVAP